MPETLLAEPGIDAKRTQRNILQPLVDLDLVHPHRFRSVRREDLPSIGFALGRTDPHEQHQFADGVRDVDLRDMLAPQPAYDPGPDASDDGSADKRRERGRRRRASRSDHGERAERRAGEHQNADPHAYEQRHILRAEKRSPRNGGDFRNLLRWNVDAELLARRVTAAQGDVGTIETRLQQRVDGCVERVARAENSGDLRTLTRSMTVSFD